MTAPDEDLAAPHFARIAEGPPVVPAGRVTDVLRSAYGLVAAAVAPLPGETERSFRVETSDGVVTLRIARVAELPALERQTRILDELERRAPEVPMPRVRRALDGSTEVRLDGDEPLVARLLTWVPGEPLATVALLSNELLADVGRASGVVAAALATLDEAGTGHYWDLRAARVVVENSLDRVHEPTLRGLCTTAIEGARPALDGLDALPTALVHHDLNGLNVLVGERHGARRVAGIIDVGDAMVAPRIADLAILISAISRGRPDPLGIATTITRTYSAAVPFTEPEIASLFPLVIARAATVAATTARLAADDLPGDPRHRRLAAATDQLTRLQEIDRRYARAALCEAAGLDTRAATAAARRWLGAHGAPGRPILSTPTRTIDLSAAAATFDDVDVRDPAAIRRGVMTATEAGPGIAVTPHAEPQLALHARRGTGDDEPATCSLGVRVYAPAGTGFTAPWDGQVQPAEDGAAVLRHRPDGAVEFWTRLVGARPITAAGQVSAGAPWAEAAGDGPVVVQLTLVDPADGTLPVTAPVERLSWWERLIVDPGPLFGLERWSPRLPNALEKRDEHLPRTHPTYFARPVAMVRARGSWFFDEHARRYLDALNNVTLVGHGHPRLVEAASRQLKRLNTNSRFVYDVLSEYLDRLTGTLPAGLDVAYLLNSGSEANDLALRMARHATGRRDIVVIDDAYHGYTDLVSDVSPSRFRHYGKPDFTHVTVRPDRYRGPFGYDDPEAGARYAQLTIDVFDRLIEEGRPPAAYIYEPLLAGGGQIVLPPGFLATVGAAAGERGILTIADEVQVGFGRLGEAFWGFQTHGPDVRPDFVSMGKAMGNGFPVSALVTARDHSQSFDQLGRFFATYGGNPVAAAVGLELLDVMAEEGLQENARDVGQYLRDGLAALGERHVLIGDVRGQGFYSGVEFVLDRESKEPARDETLAICDRMKDEGVLVYPTGPFWNVLKLKPPLTFSRADADLFVSVVDRVLTRGW